VANCLWPRVSQVSRFYYCIMRFRLVLLMLAVLLSPPRAVSQTVADSGTYFVRHGTDTVATERFQRTPTRLEGTLAIRNSTRTSERWVAVIGPDATLPLIEVTVREGVDSAGRKAKVTERARVIFKEDSAAVDAVGGRGVQTRLFGTQAGALPYLNLSFALLEQAVRRSRVAPEHTRIPFFNLGGGQTVSAKLSPLGRDSTLLEIGSVRYHLLVDAEGRLIGGRIPAQNVVVDRR
jgi:hypothetical protein